MTIMSRPSWNQTFMTICEVLAQRSTCRRLKTACLIVKNQVIVSIGYNGTTPGAQHCDDAWRPVPEEEFQRRHHEWSLQNELHGEMNALLFAGKHGIALEGSDLFTLYSPCIHCAKCIISSGVKRVFYRDLYHRDTSGIDFLQARGVEVHRLNF